MSLTLVDTLAASGALSAFDVALARRLVALESTHGHAVEPEGEADLFDSSAGALDWLAVVAALTSHAITDGHVCIELSEWAGQIIPGSNVALPDLKPLRAALRRLAVIGRPGDMRPLVLDERDRLYLHRYWHYEAALAAKLRTRAMSLVPGIDMAQLRRDVGRWFGADVDRRQRLAGAAVVLRRFSVISGGPGTGKTTTVARCIALLLSQHGPTYRIALVAPTGKAAVRLQQSLRAAKADLALDESVSHAYPSDVTTIHRLLGPIAGSSFFRHDAASPLPLDCVVVDEASMIDIALAYKLVDALLPETRLILLGDKDQLASVEAGAVMASLCARAGRYSTSFATLLEQATGDRPDVARRVAPIEDCVALLERSYRFDASSGIGRLAAAVRSGDETASAVALKDGGAAIDHFERGVDDDRIIAAIEEGYAQYVAAIEEGGDPLHAFAALGRFRVLMAHRRGRDGAEYWGGWIAKLVRRRLGVRDTNSPWYAGRAVMVTTNDYRSKLFNGDIGIALLDVAGGGVLRVAFEAPEGGIRWLSPSRLPTVQDAFVLTVHRSQGSEFDRVMLVLPREPSRAVTRELLYTAVTRARERVDVAGSLAAFTAGVKLVQRRRSALAEQLIDGER